MINANNILNLNHVKQILDNLKSYIIAYEMQCGSLPEDASMSVHLQLCEIDEFIIGLQTCDEKNFIEADFRIMAYYEYLEDDCSFDELMEKLRKYEGEV